MSVGLLSSFLSLFSGCFSRPPSRSTQEIVLWESLPIEILENILDRVENPTLTSRVSRNFQNCSQHAYTRLLAQYTVHPALVELLPLSGTQTPCEKVKTIYLMVIEESKNYEIDPQLFESSSSPLQGTRLHQIRKLTLERLKDYAIYYRALLRCIHRHIDAKTDQEIVITATNLFQLFKKFSYPLNLENRELTHLPAHIGSLKSLQNLNLRGNFLTVLPPAMCSLRQLKTLDLRGNPLSADSVKEVCRMLPSLEQVLIDSGQPALIKMFRRDFPHIPLIVTMILSEEDPL